jgi:cytochrome c oxidase subunit 2
VTGRHGRRIGALVALIAAALLLAGCGDQQNALAPASHQSTDIANIFWWTMGGSWIGMTLVVALLVFAWRHGRRRRRELGGAVPLDGGKPNERLAWYVVVGLGVATPICLMVLLFVISNIFVIGTTQAPAAGATRLTIDVIGHQWWWEVRYPGTSVVTANEIHIPARTPVRVNVTTADVIHSFWVPRLNRTIDAIPGRRNAIVLDAKVPGRYRGQCLEFCGLQHAHMAFYVFADPPAKFQAWLANQEKPARKPTGALATRGEKIFTGAGGCESCHTIDGTSASGVVGPNLTHLQTRTTLGALTIPNRKGYLGGWIMDSQHVKPGNDMPNINLTGSQLQALLAYLEELK